MLARFMCLNKDWFSPYEAGFLGIVLMDNKIAGIGLVRIRMFDGICENAH